MKILYRDYIGITFPYSLLRTSKSCQRIAEIRNPHATNEWFGRFHDDDWETWNAYPEAQVVELQVLGLYRDIDSQ